jgi:hypothetical protein
MRAAVELLRTIREAANIEFSPRLPPWSRLPRDGSVGSELRYAATRAGPLAGTSRRGRIKVALLSLFWPFKATSDAVLLVARYGARVKAQSGMGRWRQWQDAMAFAHAWNFSPRTYYAYRFWDPAIRPLATTYLQVHEMNALQVLLNDRKTDVRENKAGLAARCAAVGIPAPRLAAAIGKDAEEWTSGDAVLPRADLFIKPVSGSQGIGGERWVHDASGERWSRKGRSLTQAELLAHCRQLARTKPILVQYCLSNHPDLARYSAGPLCTFRVITYGDALGPPAVLCVTLKIARKGSDVDNIHAGGIACPVNHATGQLGSGIGYDPVEPRWPKHPETGATIEGAYLATHREVIDLALAAHGKLDVPWSVGWDIAMTPEGAVVVEGNEYWGVDIFVLPHSTGVQGEFADALLKRVREAMGSRPPGASHHPAP